MNTNNLSKKELGQISQLAGECFVNDPYYIPLDENPDERKKKIEMLFQKSAPLCSEYGQIYMIKKQGDIIGFSLWFDYHELKHNSPEGFNHIFNPNLPENYFDRIHHYANQYPKFFHLLAIAVKKEDRNMGWGSDLVYQMKKAFPDYVLFGDLSNTDSLGIYRRLDFDVVEEVGNTILVSHQPRK